ncbi:MAG: YlmH/Sll1252 family protein [Lachnospiraceae bacterium]|nr:YlmH/Sll1252 family protein [Lachnospiraceae bacterium]
MIKRIQDLASMSDRKGCVTFTDFLNLNEQNICHQTMQKFSWIKGETFGGYEGAERRIAAFVPEEPLWGSESSPHSVGGQRLSPEHSCISSPGGIMYPIHCIHIVPRTPRFAESLTHRDFLGALMSLGIDRSKTGDIAVTDKEAYLFCSAQFSDLICQELTSVRRTQVVCSACSMEDFSYTPATETIRGSIASVRLDAVMALAFGASRSSLLSLIEGGSVYVNGKLITTNAYVLKENDIVSVRKMGRFRYLRTGGTTRKGRTFAEIQKFV